MDGQANGTVDMTTGEVHGSMGVGVIDVEALNAFAAARKRIDRLRHQVDERKMILIAQDEQGAAWLEELALLETANDAVESALHEWARAVGRASIETESIRVTAWHKTRWAGPSHWDIYEKHREVADQLGIEPTQGEAQVKITIR